MLIIFLKDSQTTIEFVDYPGEDAIKFMMNFKKIFPSTFDLLLPILSENEEQLSEVTWESTQKDFANFKQLIQEWAQVELRLGALTKYKNADAAHQVIKNGQLARKKFKQQQKRLNLLHADYAFLQHVHTALDMELLEIGSKFYLPTLQQNWQNIIPKEILNQKIS